MVSRIAVISGRSRSLLNFRGPLIKEFLKAGLEVHAFAPDFEDNQVVTSSLKEIGVICHQTPMARTGMNPFYDIKTIFYLFLKLTSIKPTYLFSYNLKPVIYSGIAAYFAGVPRRFSLITGLGYAFSNHNKMIGKIVGLISRNLYRLVLKRNEKVFFQNGDDLRQFEDLGIINSRSSSLVVNGSGVDVNYFYQCTHFPRELSFLLIARFLASKGIREYVCVTCT